MKILHEDGLPLAQVKVINLEALSIDDKEEQSRLFRACCDDGFFYLDIEGTTAGFGASVEEIYHLERELFMLPEQELLQYDIDKLSSKKLNGYKPLGRNHGELSGRKDGFQSYALPKDGIMRLGALVDFERPPLVDKYMSALHMLTSAIIRAANIILSSLSQSLELSANESFCKMHQSHLPSPDLIRLLRYHEQPLSEQGSSHVPHTDLGSLSFLFTKQYGLQILGAESNEWEWMQPKEGYATVNVGDCLGLLTEKRFRSCRHRVKALPGQAMQERYSFAYFMRPNEDALMKAVSSPLIPKSNEQADSFTAGEWLQRKYTMLRRDTWKESESWMLTGGNEAKS